MLLELAHYRRMLESCGFASGVNLAAVVGDDRSAGAEPGITWVDLTMKFIRTYSKTAGHKLRSTMERYDHEHQFRVYVAEHAATRVPTIRRHLWCAHPGEGVRVVRLVAGVPPADRR
ncbi:hypothetical protein G7085_04620 [Tessaracoccus sp. HDW20]|uniref:hypothetical protein n=1 Tax=Tessaracoccus coleopterorum TaxID=2714950 RepID=UPI001E4AF413|nr:hypothetical protein [Tessaracoccus coleopterorum]NHB84148.1 hypothetical protein [Tessaracoccus coleopterorum]